LVPAPLAHHNIAKDTEVNICSGGASHSIIGVLAIGSPAMLTDVFMRQRRTTYTAFQQLARARHLRDVLREHYRREWLKLPRRLSDIDDFWISGAPPH
jgi:hypothetical protein